jgi:competence protein ComFB
MDIRNLMEDKVIQMLEEICADEERGGNKNYKTDAQSRTDTACFVLNRVPQRYVSSGRGFAYLEADFNDNPQISVDIVTLIHEGLRRVTEIKRSYYGKADPVMNGLPADTKAVYYFPTIKGRIFNGMTFEPIQDVSISITHEGQPVKMVDGRWPNPYSVVGNTPGTYLFWPKPMHAPKVGTERVFEFTLEVNDPRYEPFSHYFTIPVHAEPPQVTKSLIRDYAVNDLFLLPRDTANNDMQLNPEDDNNP